MEITSGADSQSVQRVLILAPHPDDEAIGCGGTIRTLTSQGVRCDVLFMTGGEKSHLPRPGQASDRKSALQAKRRMADESSKILGICELFYMGGTDGELFLELHRFETIVELVYRNRYQRIFCPWAHDTHSDHAATFEMLNRALWLLDDCPSIWLYEVWNPLVANRVVSIDDFIDSKVAAVEAYRQGVYDVDYSTSFIALARYRSLLLRSAQHAEAFLVVSKSQMAALGRWNAFTRPVLVAPPHPVLET